MNIPDHIAPDQSSIAFFDELRGIVLELANSISEQGNPSGRKYTFLHHDLGFAHLVNPQKPGSNVMYSQLQRVDINTTPQPRQATP
jgi:hypothetical protein